MPQAFLRPARLVVAGATHKPGRIGAVVWRHLCEGVAQPAGAAISPAPSSSLTVWALNRRADALGKERVYTRAQDLPDTPDLAVICTPADTVAGLVADLAELGTPGAIVITAGLNEAHRQAVLQAAARGGMRLLGPNGLGLILPHQGLNASFSHLGARPGGLALLSQSGALVTSMLDWAATRGLGFSHVVSLGDEWDLGFAPWMDALSEDSDCVAALLYIESVGDARAFASAAQRLARRKPVVVLKAGRAPEGQRAAHSHTGAMASSNAAIDALLRRCGLLRTHNWADFFAAAMAFGRGMAPKVKPHREAARGLTVLTNGGGMAVLAADEAALCGCPLTPLSADTCSRLQQFLPRNWSGGNPVDIIGDAPAERFVQALDILLQAPEVDHVLLIQAPTAIAPGEDVVRALAARARQWPTRLSVCWLGAQAAALARTGSQGLDGACFDTPEQAVRALALRLNWARQQDRTQQEVSAALLSQVQSGQTPAPWAPATQPPWPSPAACRLRRLAWEAAASLADDQGWLPQATTLALLAAYGIPVVRHVDLPFKPTGLPPHQALALLGRAPLRQRLSRAAAQLGFPLALKLQSPDILHKSEWGAVRLGLRRTEQVMHAAQHMLHTLALRLPQARIDGFLLQRSQADEYTQELIVGASMDAQLGPVLLLGHGGVAVEQWQDVALELAPVDEEQSAQMLARTRISRLLGAWRGRPAAALESAHAVLQALSQLLADGPACRELDINPLLLGPKGAVALDARLRIARAGDGLCLQPPAWAFAPRPWTPVQLRTWQGQALALRPPHRGDQQACLTWMTQQASRTGAPGGDAAALFPDLAGLTLGDLERLTDPDPLHEWSLVACPDTPHAPPRWLAVARARRLGPSTSAEVGFQADPEAPIPRWPGLPGLVLRAFLLALWAQGLQTLYWQLPTDQPAWRHLALRLGFRPSSPLPTAATPDSNSGMASTPGPQPASAWRLDRPR